MSKIKILHCADVHLGAKFSAVPELSAELVQEQLEVFERIAMTARNQADIFLIAGDLFNAPVPSAELAENVSDILAAAAVPVFITPGNHDPATPDSVYMTRTLPDNVYIFKSEQTGCVLLDSLETRVYGAGFSAPVWRGGFAPPAELPDDGMTNILLLHADLNADAQSPYNAVDEKKLNFCGFDYIALGHIHKAYIGKSLAYSGCTMGTGFDETGDKGYLLVRAEHGRSAEVEFVPSDARRFITADVGDSVLSENHAENFLGGSNRDIYRLRVTDSIDVAALYRFLKEKLYYFQLVDDRFVYPDIDMLAQEQSLRGAFVRLVLQRAQQNPSESEQCMRALRFGLEAFDREVTLVEDN